MWRIARRPKWIAALLLALGIAAGFAALGQWQLERSIDAATVVERDTETPVPLSSIAEPQEVMTSDASGRRIVVAGSWVEGDDVIVTGRESAGRPGDWVIRHFRTSDGADLAVAAGYVVPGAGIPSLPLGEARLVGRYVPSESPQQSDFEAGERTAIAVAELINLWAEAGPVYSGYLVLEDAPAPLAAISAPAPEADVELNLLNLFYAIEWALFGGFAVYLWWRLVRDEWERERAEASAGVPAKNGPGGRP